MAGGLMLASCTANFENYNTNPDEATKEEMKYIQMADLQPSVQKAFQKYPQVDNDTYEKVIIKLNKEVAEQIKEEVNKNN